MIRRPTGSIRTATLFPYTTLVRSNVVEQLRQRIVHGPRLRPDAWQAQAKGGLISPERMVRRIGTRRHLIEVAQQIGRVFIDAQCPATLEFREAVAPQQPPPPDRTAPRRRQQISHYLHHHTPP